MIPEAAKLELQPEAPGVVPERNLEFMAATTLLSVHSYFLVVTKIAQ